MITKIAHRVGVTFITIAALDLVAAVVWGIFFILYYAVTGHAIDTGDFDFGRGTAMFFGICIPSAIIGFVGLGIAGDLN